MPDEHPVRHINYFGALKFARCIVLVNRKTARKCCPLDVQTFQTIHSFKSTNILKLAIAA